MQIYTGGWMSIKTIDALTLKKLLDDGQAVLVDVREPDEFNAASIADAKLIPLATVAKCKLPDCQDKKLVLHCKLGKRGTVACEKLLIEDPELEVYNLEGGIVAWIEAGLPVKTAGG